MSSWDGWDAIVTIVIALCVATTVCILAYNVRVYHVEQLKAGYVQERYDGPKKP